MPAPARADYPLLDVDAARTAVSTGRTVRVGILPTHQFPDGTAGRIKLVGAPESDGPEFIQVEINVGGAKDVIPFAPGDLSPITRTQAAPEPIARAATRRPRVRKSAADGAGTPGPVTARPVTTATSAAAGPVAASPAAPAAGRATSVRAATADRPAPTTATSKALRPPTSVPTADNPAPPSPAPTSAAARPASDSPSLPFETAQQHQGSSSSGAAAAPGSGETPAAARRTARGKRQPITVTLSTTEPDHTGWQLEVKVGSRVVVKPTPLHPARAWALVTDLGNPEVARVVAGALTEHRQQAQERADRLALELAQAQEELAHYPTF